MHLLEQVAIFLLTAVLLVPLFQRLKLGKNWGQTRFSLPRHPYATWKIESDPNSLPRFGEGLHPGVAIPEIAVHPDRASVFAGPVGGGTGQVREATARPGLEAVSWHALVAPAGTPRAIVNRLHGEMTRIMKTPDVRKAIVNLDLIPVDPQSIEENQRYIASEAKKWGDLIRKLGLAGSQ